MSRSKLEWALALASKDFLIIELIADSKEPIGGRAWAAHATSNIETIKEWFNDTPNMNYGVCSGPNYVIIDLDYKPLESINGIEDFAVLELLHGPLNPTFKVKTARGGTHVYLKVPTEVSNANKFENGIDVRGGHGYVVGPSCTFDGQPYMAETNNIDIANCPEWLFEEYLREPGYKDPQHNVPLIEWDLEENKQLGMDFLAERNPAIQGQNGDDWTYETVLYLRDYGLSEETAIQLLITSGWNMKCEPYWSLEELSTVIHHAYRYAQGRPGSRATKILQWRRETGGHAKPDEWFEKFIKPSPLQLVVDNTKDEKLQDFRRWYDVNDFVGRGRRREYLVPEWIPAHGLTAILAKRGMGKSTLLLDLGFRIAAGIDWHDLPIMEGFKVVYICGEDDEGLELNAVAWNKKHNINIPRGSFIISDGIMDLMNEDDVAQWAEQIKNQVGDSRAVVILDTWQRATAHGKQNADDDMNKAIERAEILAEMVNGPLIAAFHPPKHNSLTIHGSAISENTTSAILLLDKVPDGLKLTVIRMKGKGENNYRLFRFQEVLLDTIDFFGKRENGIVPIKIGGTEDQSNPDAIILERNKRRAWAWAIRGCSEFPQENNDIEPFELNRNAVSNFIANMWENRLSDPIAENFVNRYLNPLVDLGINIFIGNDKQDKGQGTVYPKIRELFFEKDRSEVDFGEDGGKLTVGKLPGKNKEIFIFKN